MKTALLALAAVLVSVPAAAKDVIQPVQVGAERVRFNQGEFVLDLRLQKGAVRITPAGEDHSNAAFHISVFNDGDQPINFDISNVQVDVGAQAVRLLSRDEMVGKAKNRAGWAMALTALAGGLAAASAANQRDHYRATTFTPRGTYRTYISAPSVAGQFQAAAITAGTGATLAVIGNQLDNTKAALSSEMIQMTTVDPGDSYGGLVFLTRFKRPALPMVIKFTINVNGEAYPFAMRYVKKGTPMPVFNPVTEAASVAPVVAPVATPAIAVVASPAVTLEQKPSVIVGPAAASTLPPGVLAPVVAGPAVGGDVSASQRRSQRDEYWLLTVRKGFSATEASAAVEKKYGFPME